MMAVEVTTEPESCSLFLRVSFSSMLMPSAVDSSCRSHFLRKQNRNPFRSFTIGLRHSGSKLVSRSSGLRADNSGGILVAFAFRSGSQADLKANG